MATRADSVFDMMKLEHDIAFRHQDRYWNEIAKCWSSHYGYQSRFSI
jgi:hypothetical protein